MEIDSYNVLCPYCGCKCGDVDSFEDMNIWDEEPIDLECEDCNKKFEARRVVTIDYRTEKDCSKNNEEHEEGKYHCTKCDVYNVSCKKTKPNGEGS